ncbi:hypothetical protein HZS_5671 [Henneguya salminicola]|nr:hypothetical protein HZS_5671 [Henneguya salminicola]
MDRTENDFITIFNILKYSFLIFSCLIIIFLILSVFQSKTQFELTPNVSFDIHYLLVVIGSIVLLSTAAIMFRIVTSSRYIAKIFHTIFHILGVIFTVAGVWAIIQFKENNQKSHFYTFHGIFGIIFASLYLILHIDFLDTRYSDQYKNENKKSAYDYRQNYDHICCTHITNLKLK